MVYELRIYQPAEGRADALRQRFLDHTLRIFEKHGIEALGVFSPNEGSDRLVYMTRFADEAARKAAWAGFGSDPEWKDVKTKSETSGPLLKEQSVMVLDPLVAERLLS